MWLVNIFGDKCKYKRVLNTLILLFECIFVNLINLGSSMYHTEDDSWDLSPPPTLRNLKSQISVLDLELITLVTLTYY